MKNATEADTVSTLLLVVADLLRGDRHSRRTIAESTGKSLATADRWIDEIETALPDTRRVREGKTTWLVHDGRSTPSRSAASGACIAASLGSLFEGSTQERNLKDARDFILEERGEAYGDLERKFVLAPRGGECALPEAGRALDEIVEALIRPSRVRFDYTHNDGRRESLLLEPLSLVLYEHQFYLLTRHDRGFYPYRFSRMENVVRLSEAFVYPSKGEYDPRAILTQAFGIHIASTGPIEDVEIVLREPWATYALKHRWHPTQRAERLAEGGVSVTLQVRLCRELQAWILGFGDQAIVKKPDRLRDEVAARLRSAAASYPQLARPSLAKARVQAKPAVRKRAR
jgi:predicted DNA-binding transcriptional regulator YafY